MKDTVGFEKTWRPTGSYKQNLLNEWVFCNESMPVRINDVNTCAYSSDGKIICPEGIRIYTIQSLLSSHINITLLAQPDTVCSTLLTCWHVKEELWISQKLISLPWQRCKDLNICNIPCYLPPSSADKIVKVEQSHFLQPALLLLAKGSCSRWGEIMQ